MIWQIDIEPNLRFVERHFLQVIYQKSTIRQITFFTESFKQVQRLYFFSE